MGQIAYRADNGSLIEAFTYSSSQWKNLCSFPVGTFLMPHTNWPAIPKTSIKGLHFFAHHSGYPEKLPAPKSYAHTRLQIDIVKTARELGFQSNLEVYGYDLLGNQWIADVIVQTNDKRKIAFEVQLSSQHLNDFITRTKRYRQCDIEVCWFISEKPVAERLSKALHQKNISYYKETGNVLCDDGQIIVFSMDIIDKDKYPEPLPLVRFGRGKNIKRLSLKESIDGVVNGYPLWKEPDWVWKK